MELAGTRPVVDTSRRYDGAGAWDGSGSSRTRLVPVLDADLVRRLDVGQVAYVYRGGVTYVQVKRLTGRQAAISPAVVREPGDGADAGMADTLPLPPRWPAPPARGAGADAGAGEPLPDVSAVLDEAFGTRRA